MGLSWASCGVRCSRQTLGSARNARREGDGEQVCGPGGRRTRGAEWDATLSRASATCEGVSEKLRVLLAVVVPKLCHVLSERIVIPLGVDEFWAGLVTIGVERL